MAIKYDQNTDYQSLMNQANQAGNLSLARQYENQRNAKIADMNTRGVNTGGYQTTSQYQPTEVAYYSPTGEKSFGYSLGGKTYKNSDLNSRIDPGSYVRDVDNRWWQMTDNGGKRVNAPDFANSLAGYTGGKKGRYQSMLDDMEYPSGPSDKMLDLQQQLQDIISSLEGYKPSTSMSREESQAIANSQLGGMYDQNINNALEKYNQNAVQRGMFGQTPTEALKQSAIAENEVNKAAAINDLAGQVYSDDYNMARQQDADFLNQQGNLVNTIMQNYGIESDIQNAQRNDFLTAANLAMQQEAQNYDKMMNRLSTLGYADDEVADFLNVPVGTPSEQINLLKIQDEFQKAMLDYQSKLGQGDYAFQLQAKDPYEKGMLDYQSQIDKNMLDYQDQMDRSNYLFKLTHAPVASSGRGSSGGSGGERGSGGSGGSGSGIKPATFPQRLDVWQQAANSLSRQEPIVSPMTGSVTGYRTVQPSYDDTRRMYTKIMSQLGYDPADLMLLDDLQSGGNASSAKQQSSNKKPTNEQMFYHNPAVDLLRNASGYNSRGW